MGRKKKKKDFNKVIGMTALVLLLAVFLKVTLLKDFDFLNNLNFDLLKKQNIEVTERSVQEDYSQIAEKNNENNVDEKCFVEIFFTKTSGANDVYTAVKREKSDCEMPAVKFAIKTLLKGPTSSEKNKGICSEIPSGTKLISYTENNNKIIINLSSDFEFGGGGDSLYKRVYQIIKTVNKNTSKPVYLYIDNKQANVIGGEGLMIKQPLRKDSLDD